MKIYVGQTRSRSLIADLIRRGWGECTQRGEYPPRRFPWFLDNGAFGDWKADREFDGAAFLCDLISVLSDGCVPDFVVCPDRVATGLASLAFSRHYFDSLASELRGLRWYLVMQDGMDEETVGRELDGFAGVFVGGTLGWKIATGKRWVDLAHKRGLPCHIGRVGTPKRVAWARRIGADSIDSCLPLWSKENLDRFATAVEGKQLDLW